MALSLATLQEAVGFAKLAFEIYKSIEDVPGEIADLNTELEDLSIPLSILTNLLKDTKDTDPLGRLDQTSQKKLAAAVKDACADCKKVVSVFENVERRHIGFLGGHDLQARTQWLAHAWHRFGFGAEKVQTLMRRIRQRTTSIFRILSVINIIPKKRLQEDIAKKKKEKAALEKSQKEMQQMREEFAKSSATLESLNKQLESSNSQMKALTDELAKMRAEAKKAKARECIDTATPSEGQIRDKIREASARAVEKAESRAPGPGKLSKTPSIGPRVIRGAKESQKPKEKKAEVPKEKKVEQPKDKKAEKPKEKKTEQPNDKKTEAPKEKNEKAQEEAPKEKTKAGPKPPVIVQPQPPAPSKPANPAAKTKPSPSPSPQPPRGEYSVLFVDPRNRERSVVCHAMLALLDHSVRNGGGRSRLGYVGSAGFFIRHKGDCAEEIEKLDYATPSYRLDMTDGSSRAYAEAFDVLLQPDSDGSGTAPWWQGCDAKGRADLEKAFRARRPVGMRRDFFRKFDYIACFTGREYNNLLRLRAAIVAKDGPDARPKGKGRILHLGIHLSDDGKTTREIFQATADRDAWAKKIPQLKTALDGFLRKDLKWHEWRQYSGS